MLPSEYCNSSEHEDNMKIKMESRGSKGSTCIAVLHDF